MTRYEGSAHTRRPAGRRRIWSYLLAGSVAWSGVHVPLAPLAAAADETALPSSQPLRRGQSLPGARVPGTDAPAFTPGGWSFTATGALDVMGTDNVFLTQADRRSDLVFTPRAEVSAQRVSARTVLNADVDVSYDYYTRNTRLNGLRPSALIDGIADLVDDTLILDGRLATNVQQVSTGNRQAAVIRNLTENQTQVLTYGIGPTLRGRLGGTVRAEASYDFSGVSFLRPPVGSNQVQANDTTRHTAAARIGNDDGGARLRWSLDGRYERARLSRSQSRPERATGQARAEYNLSSAWSLVGRGGYDWITDSTLFTKPHGAFGLAGVIWRPSNRMHVRAEAGYRYDDFNAEAEVQYQASAALVLSASFMRDVQTNQRLLLTNLEGLARDEFGRLIDPVTGLPPDPNAIGFDFTNQAFKRDSLRVGLHGTLGRTFYSASGSYEHRDANGFTGKSWGGQAMLGRDITPRLQGSILASHYRTEGDPAMALGIRDSKTTSAAAQLDYQVARTVQANLRYIHMRRDSTLVHYRENVVVLGLSKVF